MNFKKAASTICIALSVFFFFGSQAYAAPSHRRLSGSDRYGTSTAISKEGWKETSDYAVIAYGEDFPDALSATPLAKIYNAPILLVSKDSLDSKYGVSDTKVSDELKRLKVKKIFIVGGTGVVSENVADEIKALDTADGKEIEVERIFGDDRFETSLEVAKKVGADKGIVVTTGLDFPDALSIAPIAASKGMPIILVNNTIMNEDTINYLTENKYIGGNENAPKAYIVGGTGVVGKNIEDQFANKKRLSGNSAYETNISVLKEFEGEIDYSTAFIATRNDFPDALAGSAMASFKVSPIIITGDAPDAVTNRFINSKFDSINDIRVLGGEGAVKPEAFQKLVTDTIELKEILSAVSKNNDIKSMEGKSEVALKVSTSGLPEEVRVQMDEMLQMLNDTKATISTKSNINDDKTIVKSAVDMVIDSLIFPMDMKVWMDMDMSGDTPKFREIVKVPDYMKETLPEELKNKEYMIIDSEGLNGQEGSEELSGQTTPLDYKEFTQMNEQFSEDLVKVIENYMAQPSAKDFVAYKGEESISTPEGSKNTKVYEIKLNDEILEQFLSYMDTEEQDVNEMMDFNFFGDRGIVLTYYIADGFVVSQKVLIDLQIDLAKMGELLGAEPEAQPAQPVPGVIKFELNIDSKTYNINKGVDLAFPQINEENSFNVSELENYMFE